MRNKFTLKEGEVQRILGLHKQAILKEKLENLTLLMKLKRLHPNTNILENFKKVTILRILLLEIKDGLTR